ncbi:MAG: hypothetical protein OXI02_04485 [Candidatus Dadabacteria bacterium]|nr:hypothetical protein [Candidatus Dadabacteria bacterium]MDE0477304.1 hypothetical protein [Candidatus Dadabacteria bacterium]
MKNLEQELKNYYRSKRLDSHRVTAMQASVHEVGRTRHSVSYLIPIAAVILLTIGIGLWLHISTDSSLTHQVVAEIGHNHRQHGALVARSDQYGVVQNALSELDFPIRPRREELVQDFVLIGGKYCTIQGSRAAQLKLSHRDSGIIHTLYVFPMADKAKGVEPGIYETDGMQVELWTDRTLVYGLARDR